MQARIVDGPSLRAITPAALSAYVRAEGWTRAERFGDHSDVYVGHGAEIIVPGTDALSDYAEVVSSILAILARIEDRDELQVYRDLTCADRDVVRVRAPDAEDDGSVAIDVGVDVVARARDLLLSAACAARAPRAAYRAGGVKEANDYMSRVRLGQTERGSFVVTLLAPASPSLSQPALWPNLDEQPFDRQVTMRLADGLEAARAAAEAAVRNGGLDAFEAAVPRGVSANLCEALAGLIERGKGLDVSVTWAKTRPMPGARRRVQFSRSDGEIFEEAARQFRSREPRPEERLEGFLIDLNRKQDELVGRVTLRTLVDEKPVSVRVQLEPATYSRAVIAHDQKQAVAVVGDLRRQGQRWRLDYPREFEILSPDPEDDAEPST